MEKQPVKRGRPPAGRKRLYITLSEAAWEELAQVAARGRISRSEFIERCLWRYFKKR